MIRMIKRALEIHRTERELSRLTGRELSDIGITRSDIRNVARRGVASQIF